MSENVFYGMGCLAIGGITLLNWWFSMFSDSDYGETCRDMLSEAFNLGRNTVALIQPAVGGFMTFGGGALLVNGDGPLMWIFAPSSLVCLAVAALGLIPFPLPRFMYPEWQMARRRRRDRKSAPATPEEAGRGSENTTQ